jgi:ectoine hydroxylase-related dioxygenase (phytanoyl-CoA dioxygenase family)
VTVIDAITEDEIERRLVEIDERGFTVLERVVPDELVDEITATIDRVMDETGVAFGANSFLGLHTRRLFNLLSRDPIFATMPLYPKVLPLVDRVLGGQCLLNSLTAIEMNPGQAAQPLHADDGSIALPRPHVPIICPAIWALTDFTADNGGTQIVPGSHRWDRAPVPGERPECITLEMPKGSAVVYNGSIWHGGGENRSDRRRLGVVVNYCAGYIRQEENQILAVPREMVATFPRRLQEMVGYGVYRGLLGHVETEDPGTLLDPSIETRMIWRKMR